jgi:hypothetical protein
MCRPTSAPEFHFAWTARVALQFMSCVGLLKAGGKMKHHCSILVGILEVIGASFLTLTLTQPDWEILATLLEGFEAPLVISACTMLGCALIAFALGLVISDPKKHRSPVCWLHFALALGLFLATLLELLQSRKGVDPKYLWVVILLGGQAQFLVLGLGVLIGNLTLPKPHGKKD